MPWLEVEPVVQPRIIRGLCRKPYPLHPKGCPNFSMFLSCPPFCPIIINSLDFEKSIFAIFNIFDFAKHIKKMKQKHPKWSYRQLSCCLYWQGTARKQLRQEVKEFQKLHSGQRIIWVPEGQGVNLTATMAKVRHFLEWPPRTITYQIVLAGVSH
jgi:hypothetical protein